MREFTKIAFAGLLAAGSVMVVSLIVYLAQFDDYNVQPAGVASQVEDKSEQSPVIVVICPIAGNAAVYAISKEELNGKH